MLVNSVLLTILVVLIIVLSMIFLKQNKKIRERQRVFREQEKIILRQSETVRKEQEQLEQYKKEIREMVAEWRQQLSGKTADFQTFQAVFQESQEMLLQDMQAEGTTTVYWKNPVLNMVFLHKLEVCKASWIEVSLHGFPAEGIDFQDKSMMEMIGLFENLMDNAIEACGHLNEDARWIRIRVNAEKKRLIFVLENSCGEISQRAFGEKTWKANKEEHGIGKDIIHELVSRNQGWITFAQKDGVHRVELMLPTEG